MLMTKFVLRKPVTALLIILSVAFFGIMSLNIFKFELVPDISMPMYIVYTIYPGASPEDVDRLVTKKIEENVYNLSGAKDVTCVSRENLSLVVIQYDYSQNMDIAYNDLKKSIDKVANDFEDNVQDPVIMEMDINSMPTMKIAVRNKATEDIYNYVSNVFAKEIEKVSDVSTTDISGGREDYIKIELIPEKIERYNLSMSTLKSIITAADFAYPEGTVNLGNRKLSVTSEVNYDTIESLKNIPIITGNKNTLYLEDIANIYRAKKDVTSFGRYDSEDCMVVSVQKVQSSSSVDVSKKVKRRIEQLKAQDPNLMVEIVNDQADNINASIKNVFQTMIMAVLLSMAVIFIFLGDIKASLIVGTSIPFSLLVALVSMYLSKFTLNLITLSAMVLGVGMMVDNSIVVLEACFRAKENYDGDDPKQYIKTVFEASDTIGFSVFGSTLTTVVVFAPLGFLSGLSGQFFKPLGFTIVFCMIASLISALTIVPLVFVLAKPIEKDTSFAGKFVKNLQDRYRALMATILNNKKKVLAFSLVFLFLCFSTLPTFKTELVSPSDEGMIKIDIQTMPSLNADTKNEIYKYFEDFVSKQKETNHYLLSNSASSMSTSASTNGQSLIVYLKDNRFKKTNDLVADWKKELTRVPNCTVDVSSYSTSFTSSFVLPDINRFEIYLEASDYNELKRINNKIVKELEKREDISNISTYMDSNAPIIKINIDPILCAAEGFTPALVGSQLNNMISGVELYDMIINDETLTINMQYEDGHYDSLDKIESILLTSASGNKATVKDLADITIEDTPATVQKYNKKYRTRIQADYNQHFTKNSTKEIREKIIKPNLMNGVTIAKSQQDEMLDEEFGALFRAVLIAIFLVFVVMASQFESLRYSLMVMGTVLFSFAGAIIFLWFAGLKLSMVALLGLLMLVGTAVNNGILYVDTVNQFLDEGKELTFSIIEAGAIRLRPILMTTLTTIVSMVPMSLAYGRNGEILQGLGVADIGGLVISTIMALYILPVLYAFFSNRKATVLETLGANTKIVLREQNEK